MKALLKAAICAALLVVVGGYAFAAFSKPEDAVRYRQAVMTVIGHHFGSLAAVVKGQTPYDTDAVVHDAKVIRTLSELPWEACLTPGSYAGDTTLKASALAEKDRFMGIARQFEDDSGKLVKAAETGDPDALRAQFGQVVKNCKTCHSTYRNR